MRKYLLTIYDIFLSAFIFFSNWAYIKYRKRKPKELPFTTKVLKKSGVFPITNHYYEPKFDFTENEKNIYIERNLSSIKFEEMNQLKFLENFVYAKELKDLNLREGSTNYNFKLNNGSFEEGDAEIYYQIIRYLKPSKIIEVGSGHSTLIGLEAISKNLNDKTNTKLLCIEPYENKWLDNLDIEIIRKPLEKIIIKWDEILNKGDIFFIDSSHIIRPDGDVLKFYLEILPRLKSGVIVHIHDIFTPKNYLNEWTFDFVRLWNEQYLLEGILSNSNKYEILLSLNLLKNKYFSNLKKTCPFLTNKHEPGSIYLRVL